MFLAQPVNAASPTTPTTGGGPTTSMTGLPSITGAIISQIAGPDWSGLTPTMPDWTTQIPGLPIWTNQIPTLPIWSFLFPSLPNWAGLMPLGYGGGRVGNGAMSGSGRREPSAGSNLYTGRVEKWEDKSEQVDTKVSNPSPLMPPQTQILETNNGNQTSVTLNGDINVDVSGSAVDKAKDGESLGTDIGESIARVLLEQVNRTGG
ncbi:MAG: hypothetical protein FWH54_00180 [Methanobrevibacter sp.]|nr:hypothetical protein [Methanobrevibacter sp.]